MPSGKGVGKDQLTPLGFLAAALASSVGIGNLWRFPYVALKYGGEFFLAYAVAVALGLLLLWAEMRKPRGLERILPLAALTEGIIVLYYGPLTALTAGYVVGHSALLTLLIMGVAAFIVWKGLSKGVEPFSKASMALLFLLLAYLSLQFPWTFPPVRWEGLLSGRLWLDALAQALFSLSAGMGIFYFYSKHSEIKAPLPYAVGIALGDSVAAIMGYVIVKAQGVEHSFLVGFEGLASALGELSPLFFSALFLAALSSLVSMMVLPSSFNRKILWLFPLLALGVELANVEEWLDRITTTFLLPLTASLIAITAARERAIGRWSPLLYLMPFLFGLAALVGE